MPNSNFSFKNEDISLYSMENKDKNEQASNDLKNPYLKNDEIPELEFIGKNDIIICDKKEYKINDYMKKINSISDDLLDDEKYNYCRKCENNLINFFCYICYKNICEKCYKECELNNHIPQKLDNTNNENNIDKIKKILSNLIIPIKEDEKIIKDIDEYIDKYIINHDITNYKHKDFSIINNNGKNKIFY